MDSFIQAANQRNEQEIQFEQSQSANRHSNHEVDAELERLVAAQKASIKVVGCGGAGNNTINRIGEVGVSGLETIAINTDAQDLLYTTAKTKILIGRELTRGMGAGSQPKIGEEAAREQATEIKAALGKPDLVFITAGMGGGTGTGSAAVVADLAKQAGALTIGIVTVPFTMEGNTRSENAQYGLAQLEQHVDTLVVIPNDKLFDLAPDLPVKTAFKIADEILTNAVKGIAELVTKPGLVNLDFADIKAVMGDGGVALIGVGESNSENRSIEAVEKAITNPLLDVDIKGATGALINVAGSSELTLDEARNVVHKISEELDEDAKIIWGTQISEDLGSTLQVMLIVTGVHSAQIIGRGNSEERKTQEKKNIEDELGIEFVN